MRQSAVRFLLIALAGFTCSCMSRPEEKLTAITPEGVRVSLDSITTSYEVSGVRIIHRPVYAHDVVTANLYLLGGTRQLTVDNAGIEAMLLRVSEYGTRRRSTEELRRATALTGSEIGVHPGVDYTAFGFVGIKQEFDSMWTLLAERLMQPALDSTAIELVRSQMIGSARSRRNTPDAHVFYLADSAAFEGHPYGLEPSGTEHSLARITRADLQQYLDEQMVTSRMLLVVVGDVPRATIEDAVQSTIGTLSRGSYVWTTPPPIPERSSAVVMEQRLLNTNYILGFFNGPPTTHEDYTAFQLATAFLSSGMTREIREERSLSYAVYAPFMERAIPAGGVYVTTGAPATVVPLIRAEIEELQEHYIAPQGMSFFTRQWITGYFGEHETTEEQADLLARAELYRGDYRESVRLMQELRRVRPSDVRRVARLYMTDVQFAYLGDTTRVEREEFEKFR
ncbi:MAG: M16 family metallopeptidase [Gemmatimonadaceae bacterium]